MKHFKHLMTRDGQSTPFTTYKWHMKQIRRLIGKCLFTDGWNTITYFTSILEFNWKPTVQVMLCCIASISLACVELCLPCLYSESIWRQVLSTLQYYISSSKENIYFVSIVNCRLQVVNFYVSFLVSSVSLFYLLLLFKEYN